MVALQTTPDLDSVFGNRGNDFLRRTVAALARELPVEEIWMFGSCARGDGRSDSDLDLMVVLEDDHGFKRPTAECFRILFCLRNVVPTDVVALSRSQWVCEKERPFGMYGEILKEGVLVYARGLSGRAGN